MDSDQGLWFTILIGFRSVISISDFD